jgi:hypothetical protein
VSAKLQQFNRLRDIVFDCCRIFMSLGNSRFMRVCLDTDEVGRILGIVA